MAAHCHTIWRPHHARNEFTAPGGVYPDPSFGNVTATPAENTFPCPDYAACCCWSWLPAALIRRRTATRPAVLKKPQPQARPGSVAKAARAAMPPNMRPGSSPITSRPCAPRHLKPSLPTSAARPALTPRSVRPMGLNGSKSRTAAGPGRPSTSPTPSGFHRCSSTL